MVFVSGELEYAMSASSVALTPPTRSHRVGILISDPGRFLMCIDCHLAFNLPTRADYAAVKRQFECHSCGVPLQSRNAFPTESGPLWRMCER